MSVVNVSKIYETGRGAAVTDVTLDVADGEFVVLVGPSGCGKSTTLRMIAGLETVTSGQIRIGDRVVNDIPPSERDIAMVFQSYALYPHMTVRENLAFALTLRRLPRTEIDQRVGRAASILALDALLDRRPRQLSGGQRQRVAVGRAIVREPQVFLFDEPLSNLDAALRSQMRRELATLHRTLGATMIYVTHDQVEAMTLGERIVVMKDGRVQQVDAPLQLYDSPANRFVAGFIGSPAMNFIELAIDAGAGRALIHHTSSSLPLALMLEPLGRSHQGEPVTLGVRPEQATVRQMDATASPDEAALPAQVEMVELMGSETFIHARLESQYADAPDLVLRAGAHAGVRAGDRIRIAIDLSRVHCFHGVTGERITPSPAS